MIPHEDNCAPISVPRCVEQRSSQYRHGDMGAVRAARDGIARAGGAAAARADGQPSPGRRAKVSVSGEGEHVVRRLHRL